MASNTRRNILIVLIPIILIFGLGILDVITRSAEDLSRAERVCGTFEEYYFHQPRKGYAHWRLRIQEPAEKDSLRAFDLGSGEIGEQLRQALRDSAGSPVCIWYVERLLVMHDYVAQVQLHENLLLSETTVVRDYLRPLSHANVFIFMLACSALLIVIFKRS